MERNIDQYRTFMIYLSGICNTFSNMCCQFSRFSEKTWLCDIVPGNGHEPSKYDQEIDSDVITLGSLYLS